MIIPAQSICVGSQQGWRDAEEQMFMVDVHCIVDGSQHDFTDTVALSVSATAAEALIVCWGFPDPVTLRVSRIGATEAEARIVCWGFPDPVTLRVSATEAEALIVCWGFPDVVALRISATETEALRVSRIGATEAEALRVSRIGATEAEALRVSRIGFPDPDADADADAVAVMEGQSTMSEVQFIREGSQHEEGAEG